MCLPAIQQILIMNKTEGDPLKNPEVTPNTENSSLRHLYERLLIQTATLGLFFFLFLYVE